MSEPVEFDIPTMFAAVIERAFQDAAGNTGLNSKGIAHLAVAEARNWFTSPTMAIDREMCADLAGIDSDYFETVCKKFAAEGFKNPISLGQMRSVRVVRAANKPRKVQKAFAGYKTRALLKLVY